MAEEKNAKKNVAGTKKKKRKLRLKKEVKGVLVFVLLIVAVCIFLGVLKHRTRFDFVESLPEIVLSVDETNISLQEISYYIMKLEADVDQTARLYDSQNPKAYWNVYLNQQTAEGYESGYVSDLAKNAVMDYCIRDNIYYKEAVQSGFALSQEAMEGIRYEAQHAYETMSIRQREMTQLTAEQFALIMEKEETAHQYMVKLAFGSDEGMLQAIFLELDVGGNLYEQMKEKHVIAIDTNLWDNVKVGRVTINYDK